MTCKVLQASCGFCSFWYCIPTKRLQSILISMSPSLRRVRTPLCPKEALAPGSGYSYTTDPRRDRVLSFIGRLLKLWKSMRQLCGSEGKVQGSLNGVIGATLGSGGWKS